MSVNQIVLYLLIILGHIKMNVERSKRFIELTKENHWHQCFVSGWVDQNQHCLHTFLPFRKSTVPCKSNISESDIMSELFHWTTDTPIRGTTLLKSTKNWVKINYSSHVILSFDLFGHSQSFAPSNLFHSFLRMSIQHLVFIIYH